MRNITTNEEEATGASGNDPFDASNAPGIALIVQMRLYDVLMALLHESNPDKANELLQLHTTGALAGSTPSYIGEFLTDKLNP